MTEPNTPVVAKETVVVHDEQLNIDRKVIAGQPVPPDLLEAYRAKVGKAKADAPPAEPTTDEAKPPTRRSK